MAIERTSLTLGSNDEGRRVDRIVRKLLPGLRLAEVYRLIRQGEVRLNGRRTLPDARVSSGDSIEVPRELYMPVRAPDTRRGSGDLADRIAFSSRDLLVVAKRRGELTHGPHSLEQEVRSHLGGAAAEGVSFVPGPAHRLDRNTTGLVVFGRTLAGARLAAALFRSGAMRKRYLAVVEGRIDRVARWEDELSRDRSRRVTGRASVGGTANGRPRRAVAVVRPIACDGNGTFLGIDLETGLTHQIRAQCSLRGHALEGDRKYGSRLPGPYLLHAGSLAVRPGDEVGFRTVWVDPPKADLRLIERRFGPAAVDAARRFLSAPPGTEPV